MSIYVDASKIRGAISPLIYGVVDEWFDKYLNERSTYWQDTVNEVRIAGLTNFRIGGTPTDYYHWKEPRGFFKAPAYAEEDSQMGFDMDALISFVRASGMSDVVLNVNFARGTAQEAAEWVRHCNIEKGYGVKYWEIGNELGYPGVDSWFRGNVEKYYFGGCSLREGEKLGTSNGFPLQTFSIEYPPVKDGLTVYVDSAVWQQVDDIRTAGPGRFYQYEEFTAGLYFKGKILLGDGQNGDIPPCGAVISADYHSGPHDGLIDYICQMKAVDPTIQVAPCGDEIDWYHEGVTEWTKTLLELDAAQEEGLKEFDFVAPHWHTILLGDDPCQALHRADNFEHGLRKLREAIVSAYQTNKPHKVDLPIFIDEWKAVFWSPPIEQRLWSILFVANGLGLFAKNQITQASITHLHNYLKTDGLLGYEKRDPAYKPNQRMPIFYAFQLVTSKFGQISVQCTSEGNALCVYASLAKGDPDRLCLMIINRDFTYGLKSSINIAGFSPDKTADVWTLNGDGMDLSTGININGTKLDSTDAIAIEEIAPRKILNVSDTFSYTFPAHSVVLMQLSAMH